MNSAPYEIRYISEGKRYGVFATQNIEIGTVIYRESAVVLNIKKLSDIITFWEDVDTNAVSLHPTTQLRLRSQTQLILKGMQNLEKYVAANPKYDAPMKIHKQRMDTNSVYENDQDINVTRLYPQLPMELYMRTVDYARADPQGALLVLLHTALQQINTYLHGLVQLQYPENQAWGPITSLINHACCPNVMVSCYAPPDPNPPKTDMGHIGVIAVRTLTNIREGQEISIEYAPVFGTGVQRSQQLRFVGISNCLCETCDIEKELIKRAEEDENMNATLQAYIMTSTTLAVFFLHTVHHIAKETPAAFYQSIHSVFTDLFKINYHGFMFIKLYNLVIQYAIKFNDNIRIYWFTIQLLNYLAASYGTDHNVYENFRIRFLEAALSDKIWNEHHRDTLTLVRPHTEDEDIIRPMFMLNQPHSSPTYHLLTTSPSTGYLSPISHEENLLRVQQTLARPTTPTSTTSTAHASDDEEAATAAANDAAAALAVEVDLETTKAAKAKAKKKAKLQRQREKKRAVALAVAAAAVAREEKKERRLAERVTAVRDAVVVPALPLLPVPVSVAVSAAAVAAPAPAPVSPPVPSPPPFHHRFRSSSNPEPAIVARFFANKPVRPPPEDFDDTISEGGIELRFGVRL